MVKAENLVNEIVKELERYTNLVTDEMEEAKKEVAKELVNMLKQTSPEKTGDYAKGWKTKKVGNAQVVHNATEYQLTHLLEKGHVKVGGGRVAPIVHIKPAEEKAIDEYLERVERAIKQ